MTFRLYLPMFVMRNIAKRHPWLMAVDGHVRNCWNLAIGAISIEVAIDVVLSAEQRNRLANDAKRL